MRLIRWFAVAFVRSLRAHTLERCLPCWCQTLSRLHPIWLQYESINKEIPELESRAGLLFSELKSCQQSADMLAEEHDKLQAVVKSGTDMLHSVGANIENLHQRCSGLQKEVRSAQADASFISLCVLAVLVCLPEARLVVCLMSSLSIPQISDLERRMAGSQTSRNVADVDADLENVERDRDRVRAERDDLSSKQVRAARTWMPRCNGRRSLREAVHPWLP